MAAHTKAKESTSKKIVALNTENAVESYKPSEEEAKMGDFLFRRIDDLKEMRKKKLPGVSKSVEDLWRMTDQEYTPHELTIGTERKRFEQDEDTGLRSRMVKVGDTQSWQANASSPDFYTKVQTALSILIDNNPEAVFLPESKKYEKSTLVAYNNWKRSWEITGAKQQLKNFMFNDAKYGTAFARTYPKIVKTNKRVLTKYYGDDPTKNEFEEKEIVKFNDLCRESLNPWQVWISEMARPGDWLSVDDWYFEKEYSVERFHEEMKDYPHSKSIPSSGAKMENGTEEASAGSERVLNTVTVGFYENQVLDIYAVVVPALKVVLYQSPLLNDDGKLSLWFAPWTIRDDRSIYGIGIFEIIRQDTALYDRFSNMTLDQLALSIYKMFFYKGTDMLGEQGKIVIAPGEGRQIIDPQSISFLEVPGPGAESWRGMEFLQQRRDYNSGITPQLAARYSSKTLGQDMQAKESALERMKTPLDYILDALQQEAYITLSWQKQILSTPEVVAYNDIADLQASLAEHGLSKEEVEAYLKDIADMNPKSELAFSEPEEDGGVDEEGNPNVAMAQKNYANIYPERSFGVQKDEGGELIESKESRFYRFGVDLPLKMLEWRGIVRIKPQSVLAPSKELTKRMKLDVFNLINPAISNMLAQPQHIPTLLPSVKQILMVYEEDAKDWIDEDYLNQVHEATQQPAEQKEEPPKVNISLKLEEIMTLGEKVTQQFVEKYLGIKIEPELFVSPGQPTTGMSATQMPQQVAPGGAGVPTPGGEGEIGGAPELKPLVPRGAIDPGTSEFGSFSNLNK